MHIDFRGASFLDLGPGYGYALDLARESGAAKAEFVDYDPYIVIMNTLKGFKGYRLNYMIGKGLNSLYPRKYDIILSKGSINGDEFNRREPGIIPFPRWLDQLENVASNNAHIVICPTFDRGEEMDGASYYVCSDPKAFRESWFSKVLLDRGYEIIFINGFNEQKRFPFTYYKRFNSPSQETSNEDRRL